MRSIRLLSVATSVAAIMNRGYWEPVLPDDPLLPRVMAVDVRRGARQIDLAQCTKFESTNLQTGALRYG